METIKAGFVVVTPMFLGERGSASDQGQPECAETIRGASVKGALRAAFRALNWSRLRNRCGSDDEALKALHKAEADLFGAAAKGDAGGQARFLLRVRSKQIKPQRQVPGKSPQIEYLLGMGLYSYKTGVLRDHIPAGTEFELEFALRPGITDQQTRQLLDSIRLFGLLGGLGSRCRKGFGSVSMVRCAGPLPCKVPETAEEYKAALQELIGPDPAGELPPLTAFSQHTRLQISARGRDAMKLLEKHGDELGMYRGFGRSVRGEHQTFSKPSEANFRDDHDWAYRVADGIKDKTLPRRAIFGLPHPYHLSKGGKKITVGVSDTSKPSTSSKSSTGRRASPLAAHIHRLPDGEHLLVHTLYKSPFLPKPMKVEVKVEEHRGKRRFFIEDVNSQLDWGVIDRFLDRFDDREEIRV